MASAIDKCRRALVVLIRSLAVLYGCSVTVNRDAADADLRGDTGDQKRFNVAYQRWCYTAFDKAGRKAPTKKGKSGKK